MALDLTKLKADATIAGANIPDTVLNAIATLSTNDETITINNKVGTTFQLVDDVVAAIVGTSKPSGMKTTDYVKNNMSTFKATAEAAGDITAITTERDSLKTQVADLTKKITDGATDSVLKSQLADAKQALSQKEADIAALTKTKDDEIGKWKKASETESATNLDLAFSSQSDAYFAGVTFDPKIPKIAIDALKNDVIAKVKAKGSPGWDGEGTSRKLVFKDDNGAVLNNAANGLAPFTFADFASDLTKEMIVDGKGGKGGGGTNPPGSGGGSGGGSFSIAGLKSKREVTEAIKRQLKEDGAALTDSDYQDKYDEMYKTDGVEELPVDTPR